MALTDEREIRERLAGLRQQHRDLDASIGGLDVTSLAYELQIKRLKKQKLRLKDEIQQLEALLHPDIIA